MQLHVSATRILYVYFAVQQSLVIRLHPLVISVVKYKYAVGCVIGICSRCVNGASHVTFFTERGC
jgi:hypothetical protein